MLLSEHEQRARDAYNEHGQEYDELTDEFHDQVVYPYLFREIQAALGNGGIHSARVLDAGCGSGRLVEFLCERTMNAVGIDIAQERIEKGQALKRPINVGSLSRIPYRNNMFDLVISYHSFNYVPFEEQHRAIEEQRRVLKDNGYMILAGSYTRQETCQPSTVIQPNGGTFTVHPRTPYELRALCERANFRITQDIRFPRATEEQLALVPEFMREHLSQNPYATVVIAEAV